MPREASLRDGPIQDEVSSNSQGPALSLARSGLAQKAKHKMRGSRSISASAGSLWQSECL